MFFFIFPIGNESLVRRLPYATIGLIVLNTLIWLATTSAWVGQSRHLSQLEQQMERLEQRFLPPLLSLQPDFVRMPVDELRRVLAESEILPRELPDYQAWRSLYQQYQELRTHTVFDRWGFSPARFSIWSIITSLFIHGNFLHLLFSMLFLWLVGCNIEDDWSWPVFLGVYGLSGLAAALLHLAAFPHSAAPLIGASGAIAGIMGAFMVRHFTTRVRFLYFIWALIRPFFGTFSVWAGVALPFWFLQQVLGARWSSDNVAYYAHIGGFAFGALVGMSLKFLGLEKKYIEPMVEQSFEKLKLPPKMKQAHQMLEAGNTLAATALLQQAAAEDPRNLDAPLTIARLASEAGRADEAVTRYNQAAAIALAGNDAITIELLHGELKEKHLLVKLSEQNLFGLAGWCDRAGKSAEAAELYEHYIAQYPQGKVRAKVLAKARGLYRDKLGDPARAEALQTQLRQEFPDFPG